MERLEFGWPCCIVGASSPRVNPAGREFVRRHHHLEDPESTERKDQDDEQDEASLDEEEERTQTCRFCSGTMRSTHITTRPRVSGILEMPLSRFRRAQAGLRVTLGAGLARIEAERSGDGSVPAMSVRAQQIRMQLCALVNSSYL